MLPCFSWSKKITKTEITKMKNKNKLIQNVKKNTTIVYTVLYDHLKNLLAQSPQ